MTFNLSCYFLLIKHLQQARKEDTSKLYLAIEVKTTTKDKIYIDFPQIDALCEFSEKFGAKPYIGVKFKYTKWLFLEPEKTPRTKSDNYKIEKDFALEKALEIDEITGIDRQMKF